MESTIDARCPKHGVIFRETYIDTFIKTNADGTHEFTHERIVTGAFRQDVSEDGSPEGPVTPFCPICKETYRADR